MIFTKELMKMQNGQPVCSLSDWEKRRLEILDILAKNAYGYLPTDEVRAEMTITETIKKCCSGHAVLYNVSFCMTSAKGSYSIPAHFFIPKGTGKHPLVILLNFRPDTYDMYYPAEEIIDNGLAILSVCHENIQLDEQPDYRQGLGSILTPPDSPYRYGQISIWAFAASRMMDCVRQLDEIDAENIAIAGASRLGKTALWCGANDTRFRFVFSNGAGCMGDALNQIKHKGSEPISSIKRSFPSWFCPNFQSFEKEEDLPYDQHWLMACIAPRFVCIGSAQDDLWADPESQQLTCIGASAAWQLYGLEGYGEPKEMLKPNTRSTGGQIGFHYRDGIHFLGRPDWLHFMDFMNANLKK